MHFGGLVAAQEVDLTAPAGRITAVIGPNGAGKTTVFNCITGFYRPTSGTITIHADGRSTEIGGLPGYRIAREAGIARTFQNIRLFAGMTALENLLVAQHVGLNRASTWQIAGILALPSYRRAERAAVDRAMEWLGRMNLVAEADMTAGSLPYGGQRRLEIARAMCTKPRFLCLDEPAAGLNPSESATLASLLSDIRDEHGVGILLVEHDMSVVMSISDSIVVLDHGVKIAEGKPAAVRTDPAVVKAYLGSETGTAAAPAARPARGTRREPVLEIRGLRSGYGRIEALHGIDLQVDEGEIVTLIGANGAGKTTLLRTLFGAPRATAGEIRFGGTDIGRLPAHVIARAGLAHVPEGRRILPKMSILENLRLGAQSVDSRHFRSDLDRVYDLFPRLAERAQQRAGTLSGGEQQMLALGRAIMQRPRLLLLDEPSLGLAPIVIQQIFRIVRDLNEREGMTILLVEQNAFQALALADRGYVLQNGRVVQSGSAQDLLTDPQVRAAYLEGATT